VLAHPLLPKAFKRAGQEQGPDEQHQLLALWHNRRRSILTSRQHLVNEAEHLLCELPLELSEQLPDTKAVKPRLAALARRNRRRRYDAPTKLRLQLLEGYRAQITALDLEEKQVLAQSASTPTRARAHQEGGPADPQAPPLRRHLPAHDPRPCRHRPRLTIRPAPPSPHNRARRGRSQGWPDRAERNASRTAASPRRRRGERHTYREEVVSWAPPPRPTERSRGVLPCPQSALQRAISNLPAAYRRVLAAADFNSAAPPT
jgi:hypothetical protein